MKFALSFVIFAVGMIGALVSHSVCLVRLKKKHAEEWIRLGKPTFFRQDLDHYISLLMFFYTGKFLRLGDPLLSVMALLRIVFDLIAVGVFVLIIVNKVTQAHLF